MPRGKLVAVCIGLALSGAASDAAAEGSCGDDGPLSVVLTGGLGVAAGAVGALVSSGIIATADDTRDFDFGVGAAVGIGVTAGLSALYAIVDGTTGCSMVNSSPGGLVWSVPITTVVVGSLLPIAIWGAADKNAEPAQEQAALTAAGQVLGVTFSF